MANPKLRARYRRTVGYFALLTASLAFWDVLLPFVGLGRWARATRPSRYRRIAARFRALAIQMGGVMIKVGQFLSSRLDVMPAEITEELADLQDEVPAENFTAIRELAESELGAALEDVYDGFEPVPLAAASLGQVHRARLPDAVQDPDGVREVVVKIQRPHIKELIDVDFAALRRFGSWIQLYRPLRKRVDVLSLIQELADVVNREIDYNAEAGNAEAFRLNFAQRAGVRVPRVVRSRTTSRVLTLEDVYAIKITDYAAIEAAGISRKAVAATLFDAYLKQIFEDHFFHADPHPGNLFVDPRSADRGRSNSAWELTFVDFGMVGHVPPDLQHGLREALAGIGTRDASRVVRAYQSLGVLLPGADVRALEEAEGRLFDRFWGMSVRELRSISPAELRRFAHQFRDVLFSMPFQIPHNLLLLGRAIAILSGMCAGIDPDFNLWERLSPYARQLVGGEKGSELEGWLDQIGEIVKELITIPARTAHVLTRLERGELALTVPEVTKSIRGLETAVDRLFGGLVSAALVVVGLELYRGGAQTPAEIAWVLGAAAFLWSLLRGRGQPR